ncbi:hypothetical protein [Corynebacterium sp. CCM 9204]|uniref:hypothetical protein n=1 Tax=Corynebacterium sp. CCM 9204 TaxID=3057616 RepID=UPI00352479CD
MTTTVLGVLLLSGCMSGNTPAISSNWQVTNVYTDRDHPSVLPDSLAGRAHLAFGDHTVVGDTGCAQFTGSVEFLDSDGRRVSATDPAAVSFVFRDLRVREVEDCEGAERYFHDAFLTLLDSGELAASRPQDGELLLTDAKDTGIDKRAMRLTTSG